MRVLKFKKQLERPEYIDDTERIQKVCQDKGYDVTLSEAEQLWIDYSNSLAAGWRLLPESDEKIWNCISEEAHS